jgi:HSP20 family protein
MAGLIPFSRRNGRVTTGGDFGDFYNMLDDFFTNDWPFRKNFYYDTFRVDVEDKGDEYFVEAELPGIDKKDINLELNDGNL